MINEMIKKAFEDRRQSGVKLLKKVYTINVTRIDWEFKDYWKKGINKY